MPKKKKQHYVPQFYLRFFTRDSMWFDILKVDGTIIKNVPYRQQCYKDYFYKDMDYEEQLAEIEAQASVILRKAVLENTPQFCEDELGIIKKFVLIQHFRTTSMLEYVEHQKVMLAYETLLAAHGESFSFESIRNYFARNGELLSAEAMIDFANEFSPLIEDLAVAIIRFSSKHKLLTSDNPVVLFNNYYPPMTGFSMAGLVMLLPLCPDKLMLLYDAGLYTINEGYSTVYPSKHKDYLCVNHLQLFNANKIIISQDEATIINFSKRMNYPRKLKDEQIRKIVSTLGPQKQKLMMVKSPTTSIKTEDLSFIRLIPDAAKIPFQSRDYFPRTPDAPWIERLNDLPRFSDITQQLIQMGKLKSKYSKDYSDHIKLVNDYWTDKK